MDLSKRLGPGPIHGGRLKSPKNITIYKECSRSPLNIFPVVIRGAGLDERVGGYTVLMD